MSTSSRGVTRRSLIAGIGAASVGTAIAGAGVAATRDDSASKVVDFYGPHQAGIATPVQDRLHFASFDLVSTSTSDVIAMLKLWTAAIERMTKGAPIGPGGAVDGLPLAPPDDTGEAVGLPASNLSVTIGFGPSFFERLKLQNHRPDALIDLPTFAFDALDADRSNGDICVQACADDPQVAVHAIRNLARIGFGTVGVRWSQLGFGKTSSTTPESQTPRNLFGFKDGTDNLSGKDTAALNDYVFVGEGDQPEWMLGGSYLVARRIRMEIETWDRNPLISQEKIIGRTKGAGAPFGLTHERDSFDPASLPAKSHVRLAHPETSGVHILRRGYSFVDGSDGLGRLEAGLFFLAYQRDPRKQFVPLQDQLAAHDAMNEYIQHVASGIWAIPPGIQPGQYLGQPLFI